MTPSGYAFELLAQDPQSAARRGRWRTPRGTVELPAFMPVGTQATVKGLTVEQLQATGAQMILGNTYHLMLRPGEETIAQLGGLHGFMGWPGPILTDSGGFQVFSLAANAKVSEQGVVFRSHIDGRSVQLTPERAIEIQAALRSDVAMVLDHVVGLPADEDRLADAMQRSVRWAQRSQAAAQDWQCLFAIVQGGLVQRLRVECAQQLRGLDFPGYAVGGLSVGETPEQMYDVLDYVVPELPADKPRYLMGVGRPEDLLQAIARGIDLFDCVMPTRNGRNALAFTDAGKLRLRNAQFERDARALEADCPCPACRHPRAYLRHLFQADEMLGPILLSAHNLTYYQRLLARARAAIEGGAFAEFVRERFAGWTAGERAGAAEGDA